MVEGKKQRGQLTASWTDSTTVAMGRTFEVLRDQRTNCHGENLFMWSLGIDTNWMAHNKSIPNFPLQPLTTWVLCRDVL